MPVRSKLGHQVMGVSTTARQETTAGNTKGPAYRDGKQVIDPPGYRELHRRSARASTDRQVADRESPKTCKTVTWKTTGDQMDAASKLLRPLLYCVEADRASRILNEV